MSQKTDFPPCLKEKPPPKMTCIKHGFSDQLRHYDKLDTSLVAALPEPHALVSAHDAPRANGAPHDGPPALEDAALVPMLDHMPLSCSHSTTSSFQRTSRGANWRVLFFCRRKKKIQKNGANFLRCG